MFNQKRSFFKGKLFYIILMALFVFGIWLNAPMNNNNPEEVKADTKYPASTDSGLKQQEKEDYSIMDNIVGKNQTPTPASAVTQENKSTDSEQTERGYYLVKEIKGIIMIFYYNEEGKESLIRQTDIAFSLLSTSDQELFRKGIMKNTPEELDELLQDFES